MLASTTQQSSIRSKPKHYSIFIRHTLSLANFSLARLLGSFFGELNTFSLANEYLYTTFFTNLTAFSLLNSSTDERGQTAGRPVTTDGSAHVTSLITVDRQFERGGHDGHDGLDNAWTELGGRPNGRRSWI